MAIPREVLAANDFNRLDGQPAASARIELKGLSGATGNPLPSDVAVNVRRTITCG
jgi:hypothetical protein